MIEQITPPKQPHTAMILAAGLGKRMRPLSAITPKPLIPVAGQAMIDRSLDLLVAAKVERVIINVHYLADLIEIHVKQRKDIEIIISDERDSLLETGGGIAKALPLLGTDPFYLLNSDTFWVEGTAPNLSHLCRYWRDDIMDALLLLSTTVSAVGYEGRGDFFMDRRGHLRRRARHEVSPHVYSGAAILHPRLFDTSVIEPHSLNREFDQAIAQNRLFGFSMDGIWMHVGTPGSIAYAEKVLTEGFDAAEI